MAAMWRVLANQGSPCSSSSFCHLRSKVAFLKGPVPVPVSGAIQGTSAISTSSPHQKSGPKTVGVPAWAKAAQRRRRSVMRLHKPKSMEQIQAEYRVANDPLELSVYTTTRRGPLTTESGRGSMMEDPQIAVTRDGSMALCYHPSRPYPLQHSKSADTRPWWHLGNGEVEGFRDSLTEEEIKEARMLRKKDPKLWTVNTLSRLFRVKPLAFMIAVPLNDQQKQEVEVERQVLSQWSEYRRKEYRANQEMERQRYMEETRGREMLRHLGIK